MSIGNMALLCIILIVAHIIPPRRHTYTHQTQMRTLLLCLLGDAGRVRLLINVEIINQESPSPRLPQLGLGHAALETRELTWDQLNSSACHKE